MNVCKHLTTTANNPIHCTSFETSGYLKFTIKTFRVVILSFTNIYLRRELIKAKTPSFSTIRMMISCFIQPKMSTDTFEKTAHSLDLISIQGIKYYWSIYVPTYSPAHGKKVAFCQLFAEETYNLKKGPSLFASQSKEADQVYLSVKCNECKLGVRCYENQQRRTYSHLGNRSWNFYFPNENICVVISKLAPFCP